MNSQINLGKLISIGIDSNIRGAGIGQIVNPNSRVYGFTLFCFFFIINIPKILGKTITAKVFDYRTTKVDNKLYFLEFHPTFRPDMVFVRNRQNGLIDVVHKFKLIDDDNGFKGILVYKPKDAQPSFYRTDEYYFVHDQSIVKGYVNHKEAKFVVLSIVD